MPLRFLFYVADIYSALTKEAHLDGTPKLELEAVMLNINPGHNKELLSTCKSLHDYSEYPARVRRYSKEMVIEDAWEDGIEETSTLIAKLAENGDLVQLEELGKTPDGLKALLKNIIFLVSTVRSCSLKQQSGIFIRFSEFVELSLRLQAQGELRLSVKCIDILGYTLNAATPSVYLQNNTPLL